MATERRRQQLLLAALVVVLLVAIYRLLPSTSATQAPASNNRGATAANQARGRAGDAKAGVQTPDVHIEALEGDRPKPIGAERNLFRFKPKAPPPPPPTVRTAPPPGGPGSPEPAGPPPVPGVPPITVKFIGTMGTQTEKIAVLSDGRSAPFYGREGEIVDGRYRILKIGVESIELSYVDGRGRTTIRLSGQ